MDRLWYLVAIAVLGLGLIGCAQIKPSSGSYTDSGSDSDDSSSY